MTNTIDLKTLMQMMTDHRAVRVKAGDLEVELHPSAFQSREEPQAAQPDDDKCACGHSLQIEHNEHGCIAQTIPGVMPCSAETCARTSAA